MHRLGTQIISAVFVALLLTSCGGGSSGGVPLKTTFASSELVAACSGVNCSASSGVTNTYSGSGTGVWHFNNTSEAATVGDINIQNVVAGKTITLLFSNGQDSTAASTMPSLGVVATPASVALPNTSEVLIAAGAANAAVHTHLLHTNHSLALDMFKNASRASTKTSANAIAIEPDAVASKPLPVALGDTKTWKENAYDFLNYSTTAKVVCPAGALGRRVVFWVQTSIYAPVSTDAGAVTDANLAAYQSQFCGANNNDGQYAKVTKILGDVWGQVPAAYSATRISDTAQQKQDVNIVIVAPAKTSEWGGYFHSLNNGLKTASAAYADSNEALLFFVNSRQSQNYTISVLIHELTHMINFYQRGILHSDAHSPWLEETSAMMMQDLFDPGLPTPDACLPILCQIRDFATRGAGISYFNWPTADASISKVHYYMGASFAAFLNRRYGPVIAIQLMTDCYTPSTNSTSFACLDFLIKQNGGAGFADEFAKMGASVYARLSGTGEPSKYGFPAKSGIISGIGNLVGSYAYTLPALDNWWATPRIISIPTASGLITYSYTTQTYKIDTLAAGKTSYVRTGVSVPAKTSLTVIVK